MFDVDAIGNLAPSRLFAKRSTVKQQIANNKFTKLYRMDVAARMVSIDVSVLSACS